MSFVCMKCKQAQVPGSKMNKVVTDQRDKTYETVTQNERNRSTSTEISRGWEIVREIAVCNDCFKNMTGNNGRVVQTPPAPPKTVRPSFTTTSRRDTFKPQRNQQSRKPPVIETVNRLPKK